MLEPQRDTKPSKLLESKNRLTKNYLDSNVDTQPNQRNYWLLQVSKIKNQATQEVPCPGIVFWEKVYLQILKS